VNTPLETIHVPDTTLLLRLFVQPDASAISVSHRNFRAGKKAKYVSYFYEYRQRVFAWQYANRVIGSVHKKFDIAENFIDRRKEK